MDVIDLNMGCPVSKVVKTGAGSSLMIDPRLAASIIEASVRAAEPYGKPVTVKFRSGWDEEDINAPEFAKMCIDSGAKALAIHKNGKIKRIIFLIRYFFVLHSICKTT